MRDFRFDITTDGDGDFTETSTESVNGYVEKVEYVDGDLADGTDLTITATDQAGANTILAEGDADNDAVFYPRAAAHDTTGTTIDEGDDTASFSHWVPIHVSGKITVTVANGGDTKSGTAIVWIRECK